MTEPHLLVTKFIIPPVRAHVLPRLPLIEHLNQSSALPLVLLSAGAGFGKTTLLAAWAGQLSFPVAWLSLDRLDNDPLRFWSAVLAAVRTLPFGWRCGFGTGASTAAAATDPAPDDAHQ